MQIITPNYLHRGRGPGLQKKFERNKIKMLAYKTKNYAKKLKRETHKKNFSSDTENTSQNEEEEETERGKRKVERGKKKEERKEEAEKTHLGSFVRARERLLKKLFLFPSFHFSSLTKKKDL